MELYNLGLVWRSVALDGFCRPALVYRQEPAVTFGDLGRMSEAIGALILREGARRGDVIAIANEKTPYAYAAMIACLKLGMPYVCLDSASPPERLRRICETARPRMLFHDGPEYAESMRQLGLKDFPLDGAFVNSLPKEELSGQIAQVDGETIAYIMFTSGSTGTPKGVAVPHGNVIRFMNWAKSRFQIDESDIFAQLSPMYFDNSVFDFYGGLFSGAALAPVSRALLRAPYELVSHVAATACSIWFSVPSLLIYLMTMKALNPEKLPALRSIIFGGEGYPKIELKKLFDLFPPPTKLTNVYGPTECTCICSSLRITEKDFEDLGGLPCLGTLNPDFDHIVENPDESGAGELILLGPQVAAGYFNDEERSRGSFFRCGELNRYGKRAYRTGDLVREKNGRLYFAGRKDNQIKHMGYRIELEEIEAALMRLGGVSQAAAVYARQNSAFGKIVAFVAHEGQAESRELLRELAQYLPSYMIPQVLNIMPCLPKNANGKVDRLALLGKCR